MCGILISKQNKFAKVSNPLAHRGVVLNELTVNPWHIQFNSLPLSSHKQPQSGQPVIQGDYVLCFNGEIFNYDKLDPEASSDVHYLSNLLADQNIYKLYVESSKWDGFWAIAIVEVSTGDLYWFTDWLGKKQLYHRFGQGICSEIKPLVDPKMATMPYVETMFRTTLTGFYNVYRSLPGRLYKNHAEIANCFGLNHKNLSLYELIHQSVVERVKENRLESGLSVLLSGGLDSNIIMHHLSRIMDPEKIDVVSYISEESEQVEKCANYHGVRNINWVDPFHTMNEYEQAVKAYELSLDYGSLMPNYLLFKNCKSHIVLTGDGSDEFFGGYRRSLDHDTFRFDVFSELPFYHNVRLDRMSMIHTKEARSPLMSYKVLQYAMTLDWANRQNKNHLRSWYRGILPDWILDVKKTPLRVSEGKNAAMELCKSIHNQIFKHESHI
jgi:asparagine synthase (glutamine-hydrolysing)